MFVILYVKFYQEKLVMLLIKFEMSCTSALIAVGRLCLFRDVIVPAFPGTLLLSQWIATKAFPGKTGTNHIPVY